MPDFKNVIYFYFDLLLDSNHNISLDSQSPTNEPKVFSFYITLNEPKTLSRNQARTEFFYTRLKQYVGQLRLIGLL